MAKGFFKSLLVNLVNDLVEPKDFTYHKKQDNQEEDTGCNPRCRKKDGSHDHRCNRGNDRTPAQKQGDKRRRKEIKRK